MSPSFVINKALRNKMLMRRSHSPWISMQKENSEHCRQFSGPYAQLFVLSYGCYINGRLKIAYVYFAWDEFHPKKPNKANLREEES